MAARDTADSALSAGALLAGAPSAGSLSRRLGLPSSLVVLLAILFQTTAPAAWCQEVHVGTISRRLPFSTTRTPRTLDQLRALEKRTQQLSAQIKRAIVAIQDDASQGSGVIVSREGLVLTAAHVVEQANRGVVLRLHDGTAIKGVSLGLFRSGDAGMIRITSKAVGDDGWPFLKLALGEQPQEGTWCLAVGHPGGYRPSRGSVVRLGRVRGFGDGLLTTDCTLIGGDSGGPLIDFRGRVLGIHSRIGRNLTNNVHVSVGVFQRNWKRLASGEVWGQLPGSPYIGIKGVAGAKLARIAFVYSDSPAERAGLKVGDVVLKLGNVPIGTFDSLVTTIKKHAPGEALRVTVRRGSQQLQLHVVIGRISLRHGQAIAAGPIAAGPVAAGPVAAGPVAAGPVAAGPVAAGPIADGAISRSTSVKSGIMDRIHQIRHHSDAQAKHRALKRLVEPQVRRVSQSTVKLYASSRPVGLGLIVRRDGYIVTKASLLLPPISCRLPDGRRLTARIVATRRPTDLALIRIDADNLTPVSLRGAGVAPPPVVGSLVVTPGAGGEVAAVGIVGSPPRTIPGGMLGVMLDVQATRPIIKSVIPKSPADAAGLKAGDVVTHFDGRPIETRVQLIAKLQSWLPDDVVKLRCQRRSNHFTRHIQLTRFDALVRQGTPESDMQGPLSQRRCGFSSALQHDSILLPRECGGALLDLQGRMIGLNIARSSRASCLALPTATVEKWVRQHLPRQSDVTVPLTTRDTPPR